MDDSGLCHGQEEIREGAVNTHGGHRHVGKGDGRITMVEEASSKVRQDGRGKGGQAKDN